MVDQKGRLKVVVKLLCYLSEKESSQGCLEGKHVSLLLQTFNAYAKLIMTLLIT
jgi:hypothetical protein